MNRPDTAAAGPSPALREELRSLAVELALSAGALVRDGRQAALAGGGGIDTKSTPTDVVTVMDRASEEHLRERISRLRPQDAVLGEETGGQGSREGITWVVDPIDGTVNYLYGRSDYTVSVAAVVGDPLTAGAWHPVAGAVARPETGEVWHAHLGGGAAVQGPWGEKTLTVNTVTDVGLSLLATGFAYDAGMRREQAQALVTLLPAVRDIRRGGSAALDLCAVAAGEVDAYAERGVHIWDIAAGQLIAAEAGAHIATWHSGPERPQGLLAASPGIAVQLGSLLATAYGSGEPTPA